MKISRTNVILLTALLIFMLLLGACSPAATPTDAPAPTADTSEDTPVEPTDMPEPEEPTDEAPVPTEEVMEPGGRVVVLISEDLETMNPYLTTALITVQVTDAIIEPLVQTDQNGEYQPILVERVPTEANGDVTNDGTSVTWRLRQDVVWSDGTPFTSADVLFTYNAASNPDSGSVRTTSFEGITSIEAPDDFTVVVTYEAFNSSFLDQFKWGILPASAGDAADMLNWAFNRNPVGTGPFVLTEWVSGDHITLSRNELYREEGKPHLDELVFQVVPSEEVRTQVMLEGDAQVMMWPGSNLREVWESSDNVRLESVEGIWILRMFLNLSDPGDGSPGADNPHPILGDVRVREAMALAIDYDAIVNDLALGRVTRVTSPFALGWYNCDIPGDPFDQAAAAALLEEAGWTDADGDGIREASGALYAEDGTRLSLNMVGYSGFKLLEQTELVIADYLKQVGIEVNVSNEEMAVLFGGWTDQAPRKVGTYDILIYDTGTGINPQQHIADYFLSSSIPTEENGGVGANYTRFVSEEVDALISQAGTTPDLADRKALYCQAAQIIHDSYSQIFLYQFQEGHAFNTMLSGNTLSTWGSLTWDVENWMLEQ